MDIKDIASGLMSSPFDLKEIFYSNLLLLGFDSEAQEASCRIPFNRDMFLYPNKKGMEIVLHFLFSILDPALAFQEFRDCWPIKDKKLEQQFRKSCNSWLTRISKEEPDSNLPRIGPSLFLSPGGDRFYEMLFYFSCYVVRQVMARDHGHSIDGAVTHVSNKKVLRMPCMMKICSSAMLIKMLSEKNRFFQEALCNVQVQECWKSHAKSTTKEHRKLCKENRELERKLNPMGDNVYLKEKTNYLEETELLRRTKQLQEVRDFWSKLESFHDNTKEKRAILNEILENNEAKVNLDGSSIQLQIPDALTTKYRQVIQMKNIRNTYEEGKLNILSLTQLSNLSLHELKEKIRRDGVPNLEQRSSSVKHELRTHATYLIQARNLRTSLQNDSIPQLKKSIEKLQEECYSVLDETVHSPVDSLGPFDLGLLPTTPSQTFATATQLGYDCTIPEISLKKTPKRQATPDVIENLTSSVREQVSRGQRQSDKKEFPADVADKRTVDEIDKRKAFVSKIPKPVNRRLSRTPDVLGEKTSAVRRRSLTSTKKIKRNEMTMIEKNEARKRGRTSMAGLEAAVSPAVEQNYVVTAMNTQNGQITTPLATGTKSVLQKHHSSARNILAEKIASSVFSNGPSQAGSSLSSSGENTPLDLALADPVANLNEEAFVSRDLICRTPFKKGDIFSDKSDDEDVTAVDSGMQSLARSLRSRLSVDDKTTASRHDASSLLQLPSLKSDVTPGYNVAEVYVASLIDRPLLQQSTCVTGAGLTRNTSVNSSAAISSPASDKIHVNKDVKEVILQYQRLKEAEELRNGVNFNETSSAPTPQTSSVSTNGVTCTSTRTLSEISSLYTDRNVRTNPVLLRYQQWKTARGELTSSDAILRAAVESTKSFFTPEVNSRNVRNRNIVTPSSCVVSDTLTPVTNDRFLRDQRGDVRARIDESCSDETGSRQLQTSIISPKGFDTPMSSIGNYLHEFGETPLENIAAPEDINRNCVHLEAERDCSVKSRLSFDFATPTSSLPGLNTSSSRKTVNSKINDINQQLIPVNVDDLLQDDYWLPVGESLGDFRGDVGESQNSKEGLKKLVENRDPLGYSTPFVKVGQLIEFD